MTLSDGAGPSWTAGAPPRYGYLVAHAGPPSAHGLIADVVLDGAGLYLAATTATLAIRVRLARLAIPDLPVVPTGISLTHGPIDGSLWQALVARARAALPHEVLLAVVARPPAAGELLVAAAGLYTLVEPQLDEAGTGDWQPQRASAASVRATPIPDALLEVHSHHTLGAYFSTTDDRDETARRVYGVLGRLDRPNPEVAFRVATGCAPHAVEPVPFDQVFAGNPAPFRDLSLEGPSPRPLRPGSTRPKSRGGEHRRERDVLGQLLLADIAEDLAAIRDLLEAAPGPAEGPRPWSAR
ncbi:MAG: Mov34/MPN/PAD-1 family protein [Chloroflexi bacterium]|nr:Mov34/MPN/PAD-1 family protein [Chloroflexota bacterium]